MNKLLTIFPLVVVFNASAPPGILGQASPAQTSATQAGASAEQDSALKEANSLSAKVFELYNAGRFDEALPIAENVLTIRERVLPANDRRIADALANVASLHLAKHETDKAEKLYGRALVIYEAAGDTDSKLVVSLLKRLVFVAASKRDFEKAELLAQRIVSIAEKKYKPQQLETATALVNLAEVYRLSPDHKRAQAVYARILDIVENISPSALPQEIAQSLSNYLNMLYALDGGKDSELTERIKKLFLSLAASAPPGTGREIQGGLLNKKALSRPQPPYPASAKAARAQGMVAVQVTVDETGRVIAAKAISSPADLSLARVCEEAARKAIFEPTLLDGVPVKVTGVLTYRFVLQ